jgi:hypothetical protein
MIGGIEETSASFEARSAPRSYPTPITGTHALQQTIAIGARAAPVRAAHRVLTGLHGEIMDMNRATHVPRPITVSRFAGSPSRTWLVVGIPAYEAASRRTLFSKRKITASHTRVVFSATASSTG